MHPSKFFIFAVIFFCALGKVYAWPGGFPGTDPDHIPKDPFVREYVRVETCLLKYGNKTVNLSEPGLNYKNAYEIIALTPTGRKLLASYQIENKKQPFQYVEIDYSVRRRMNFAVNTSAAYNFEGKDKIIFYDPQDDLGLLLVFLSHELTHAVDPEVTVDYFRKVDAYKNLPRDEYLKIHYESSFRIERRAFNMQDKILPELLKLTPCYANYLQQHRDRGGLRLFNPTPDSYIYDAYGIPRP
jgi:hypothetical protein